MKTNNIIIKRESAHRIKCDAPFLFSIPQPYEDSIIERDKHQYVKMQQVILLYKDLKSQLLQFAEKHEQRYYNTRLSIEASKALLNRYTERRQRNTDLFG